MPCNASYEGMCIGIEGQLERLSKKPMMLLQLWKLGQRYRTSMLRGTRSFALLRLGRHLESGLCFRLLGRQWSLIVESRNSYAILRSFSWMFIISTTW